VRTGRKAIGNRRKVERENKREEDGGWGNRREWKGNWRKGERKQERE
jgi:hypothetical protein